MSPTNFERCCDNSFSMCIFIRISCFFCKWLHQHIFIQPKMYSIFYMQIYLYTHTHTHIYVCLYIYIRVNKFMHIYIWMHTYIYALWACNECTLSVYTYTCTYIYILYIFDAFVKHTHSHTHTCTHTDTYFCIYRWMTINIHYYMCVCMYTCIHMYI